MRDWQAFVREHFHGRRAASDQARVLSDQTIEELAQHVEETWRAHEPWMTIVGVAGNVRHFGLDDVARRESCGWWSRGAMRPVLAGLAIGSVGAVFAARLLGTLLFEVKPGDPAVVAGIAALLAVAAIAASLVPGARATRVDPITVLKAE